MGVTPLKGKVYEHHPVSQNPTEDKAEHRELVLDETSGLHRFFRMSGPRMQTVFSDLVDHTDIPRILIHENSLI